MHHIPQDEQPLIFGAHGLKLGVIPPDRTIREIWDTTAELRFTRDRTADALWGYCRTCYYADVCRAGCTWTAHVLFGKAGNNPYCHHRALEMKRMGKRERVVRVEEAPGLPFDHARWELIEERDPTLEAES